METDIASAWETQVRTFKTEFDKVTTVAELRILWQKNINLGHRLMGRVLLGKDVEELISRHEGE